MIEVGVWTLTIDHLRIRASHATTQTQHWLLDIWALCATIEASVLEKHLAVSAILELNYSV